MVLAQVDESPSAAAVFRRCGPFAADTDRVHLLRLKGQHVFQTDVVLPKVAKVVLVEEPFAAPKVEISQVNRVGGVINEGPADVVNAEVFAVDPESMEMGVGPSHRDLEGVVEISVVLSLRTKRRRQIIGLTRRNTTLNW
jgi:hypothetical protein